MRQRFYAFLICLVLICAGYFYSASLQFEQEQDTEVLTKGLVLTAEEVKPVDSDTPNYFNEKQWAVKVRITEGIYKNREVETIHYEDDNPAYSFSVHPGDRVVLSLEAEDYVLQNAYILDLARERYLVYTMANTLILAYTGSSLPLMLLLLASDVPYTKYINLDMIASEIVRALAGSIGLFLAVPLTAVISAFLCKRLTAQSKPKAGAIYNKAD